MMTKNVVYVAPFPMEETLRFANALAKQENTRLFGVFQTPPQGNSSHLFHDIVTIGHGLSAKQIEQGIRILMSKYGAIHRVIGILEQLQEPLAVVRDNLNIEGMKPTVAHRFRDKAEMKRVLTAHNIPCARFAMINTIDDAWAFVDKVGFPLVLKPPTGAGCKATYRVSHPGALISAFEEIPVRPILAEEFLHGVEYSMETFTLNGTPRFVSFSRYYPSPLEVMQNPWIQWVVLFPKELNDPIFSQAQKVGFAAIRALGLETAMTHMEWFQRRDGSVAIGEIGARPPGAQIAQMTGLIHGFDAHKVWAKLMVHGAFDIRVQREHAGAIVFLRGKGHGRIVSIEGLAEAQKKMGALVYDVSLPKVGALRSSSYEGDGWVIIRHHNTEVVKKAAFELIQTVRVRYQN
jgi:biotin carboxylase